MQNTHTFSKATQWLFYSICAYFLMNGAQLWETALMVPAWTAAPPSSLIVFQKSYALDFKVFWIVMHSLHEIIFIVALCYNWKIKKRRNLMVAVFLAHLGIRIWTLIYFAPTLMEFQRLPHNDTVDLILKEKAAQWRHLNDLRVALFFVLNFLLIPGLKIKEKDDE
ncbi:transposase [Sphingobacterium sp. WOUb80]|uniref:transposase n=1 Tax=Sphingobacterium sp. WOUb80 TaxID=3234028 RepID=UPI003CE8CA14